MTPPLTPPSALLSDADIAAHAAGSYVRRPARVSRESVILPVAPAARRRLIALRRL